MVVVDRILKGELKTGFVMTDVELLALQLRKVAECIALSAICSHREAYQKLRSRFDSDWNAAPILRQVEEINPHFYPRAARQILDPKTGRVDRVEHIRDGFLTREELVSMVNECGNILHQFNPYQQDLPDLKDFSRRAKQWRAKIYTLLSHHLVQLPDSSRQWWVIMKSGETGGVQVFEMKLAVE